MDVYEEIEQCSRRINFYDKVAYLGGLAQGAIFGIRHLLSPFQNLRDCLAHLAATTITYTIFCVQMHNTIRDNEGRWQELMQTPEFQRNPGEARRLEAEFNKL